MCPGKAPQGPARLQSEFSDPSALARTPSFPPPARVFSRTSNISPGGSVETGFYTVCFCVVLFAGVLSGQEHNNCYLFSCWPHWMFVSCVSFLGCCNK